jgi:hypothetical protein
MPKPPVRTGGVAVRVNDELDGTEAIHRELLGGVDREPGKLLVVGNEGIGSGGDVVTPLGAIARIEEPLGVLERQELELGQVLVDGHRVRRDRSDSCRWEGRP